MADKEQFKGSSFIRVLFILRTASTDMIIWHHFSPARNQNERTVWIIRKDSSVSVIPSRAPLNTKFGVQLILTYISSSSPGQSGRHFGRRHFQTRIQISLKLVPGSPVDDKPALVQVMAWRQTGTSHNLNQWCTSSLTHICSTRRWVNPNQIQSMTHDRGTQVKYKYFIYTGTCSKLWNSDAIVLFAITTFYGNLYFISFSGCWQADPYFDISAVQHTVLYVLWILFHILIVGQGLRCSPKGSFPFCLHQRHQLCP